MKNRALLLVAVGEVEQRAERGIERVAVGELRAGRREVSLREEGLAFAEERVRARGVPVGERGRGPGEREREAHRHARGAGADHVRFPLLLAPSASARTTSFIDACRRSGLFAIARVTIAATCAGTLGSIAPIGLGVVRSSHS